MALWGSRGPLRFPLITSQASMGVPTIAFLMSSDRPDLTRLLFQAGPCKLKKCACVYIHKYIDIFDIYTDLFH